LAKDGLSANITAVNKEKINTYEIKKNDIAFLKLAIDEAIQGAE
jgi:hypothetical protein